MVVSSVAKLRYGYAVADRSDVTATVAYSPSNKLNLFLFVLNNRFLCVCISVHISQCVSHNLYFALALFAGHCMYKSFIRRYYIYYWTLLMTVACRILAPLILLPGLSHVVNSLLTYLLT